MKPNVGETDRHVRFVAAGALLASAMVGRLSWPMRVATLLLGASQLLAATTGHCAVNSLLDVDTNREPSVPTSPPQPMAESQSAAVEGAIRGLAE